MSEQNTHSYITFSILNCCNFLKFNVFWWVLWVYRWFKHKYGNRGEKVHKTEHFGAKENMKRKSEPSPIDRGLLADRSAGVSKRTSKTAERLPIDRAKPADRSAQTRESRTSSADRSWNSSRSIGSPTSPDTAWVPIDRGLAADRSAKTRQALRRRFPSILGSEFPPKLGQITCSINRILFRRKREVHIERNTTRISRTTREGLAIQKGRWRRMCLQIATEFSLFFYFPSLVLLVLIMNPSLFYIFICLVLRG